MNKSVFLMSAVLLTAGVVFAAGEREASVKRVMMPRRLLSGDSNLKILSPIDTAAWIWRKGAENNAFLVFKKSFESDGTPLRIHVSADERYVLYLDGKRISRGPDRSTVDRWTFKTYDIAPAAGRHEFVAWCWRMGQDAPFAQLGWAQTGGFVLKAEGAYDGSLTTGKAKWKCARLDKNAAVRFFWDRNKGGSFGTGHAMEFTGDSPVTAMPAESEFADADTARGPVNAIGWGIVTDGWRLYPSTLPDMLDSPVKPGAFRAYRENPSEPAALWTEDDGLSAGIDAWNALLRDGAKVTVPANSDISILWDLDDYFCAYPEIDVEGGSGATVEIGWAEALKDSEGRKTRRDKFAGMGFDGFVDTWHPNGAKSTFALPWFRTGRWVSVRVKTAAEPVTFTRLALYETHFPERIAASFESDDATLGGIQRIAERGMYMCSHEMGFDCPFYEQQMYPGDTRVQLLVQGVIWPDDSLIRRDIELFDFSRRDDGSIGFNFPTRGTQDGWTYTLIWPLMLADYAMWHGDTAWLKARLPGLRHTMAGAKLLENSEGLLENLPGWSFMDWVPAWEGGIAPDGNGLSSINNLFYVYDLKAAAVVEDAVGDAEMAKMYRAQAAARAERILEKFWDGERGLLADDAAKKHFSEHAQSLAIILDILPAEKLERVRKGLLEDADLSRCTVYFSHYLFEAYAKIARTDLILKRFDLWRGYVADLDLKTPMEAPGDARSDCHAWGSHPLYHLHANIAGVKPAENGFKSVRVAPQPGGLKTIKAKVPHPKGFVLTDLDFSGGSPKGSVTLPEGVPGVFVWNGVETSLNPGRNEIPRPKAEGTEY